MTMMNMNTSPRHFSPNQRAAVGELHGFACAACGVVAHDGHVDHVVPYADGGATVMGNAQWLCRDCNLRKGRRAFDYRQFLVAKPALDRSTLRRWQHECLDEQLAHLQQGGKSFGVAAGVSSGKTMQAMAFYLASEFDIFVVITPKSGIRSSWGNDAKKMGLVVERVMHGSSFNPHGTGALPNGYVLNAQMMNSVADKLAFICQNLRTLLIIDEAHHYGEGNAQTLDLTASFRDAAFSLALSGTPFRTDKRRIMGFGYAIDGNETQIVPEYIYDTETSLAEGNVALVTHAFVGGSVTLERAGAVAETYSYKDNYAEEPNISATEVHRRNQLRLRLSTMDCRDWQVDAVLHAKKDLDSLGSPWAGLVICRTIEQADAIAEYLEACGEKVMRIYSEVSTEPAVEEFNADHSYRWGVTITKIGEGVSIPRLRIGIWLTPVTARTSYEQYRGRFSRLLPGVPQRDQTATFYLPADPRLIEYAENSRRTILHRFSIGNEVHDPENGTSDGEKKKRSIAIDADNQWIIDAVDPDFVITDLGSYSITGSAVIDGVEVDGSRYSAEEVKIIREELVRITNSPAVVNRISHAKAILWHAEREAERQQQERNQK